MNTFMCIEHRIGHTAAANAHVNVRTASALSTSWFTTKPYGYQRPTGAPPS